MTTITGPKILSLNPNSSTSVPIILSEDGTTRVFAREFFDTTIGDNYAYDLSMPTETGYNSPRTDYIVHDKVFVRRNGEFSDAITAVATDQAQYDNNASRDTNNAPSQSLFSLPFIFSNWTPHPVLRSIFVKYLTKWLWDYPQDAPTGQITVWKLSTLNARIQQHKPFDDNTNIPFPSDVVPLDLSTYHGEELLFFGNRIVDLSDTFEGTITGGGWNLHSRNIASVLDKTLLKQDIDFGLFLSAHLLRTYRRQTTTTNYMTPKLYLVDYDPVEVIFSYLSAKKYEDTDFTLSALFSSPHNATSFGCNILFAYRVAHSYLIQEAKKQLRWWLSPSGLLVNKTYSPNQLVNKLNGTIPYRDIDINNTFNPINSLAWIPYEYVNYSNANINYDSKQYTPGKNGLYLPKIVRKPRSTTLDVNNSGVITATGPIYFQQYGNANNITFSKTKCLVNAWPCGLIDTTFNNGHIFTNVLKNSDNIIHYDFVEDSSSFPEPDIVTDI